MQVAWHRSGSFDALSREGLFRLKLSSVFFLKKQEGDLPRTWKRSLALRVQNPEYGISLHLRDWLRERERERERAQKHGFLTHLGCPALKKASVAFGHYRCVYGFETEGLRIAGFKASRKKVYIFSPS